MAGNSVSYTTNSFRIIANCMQASVFLTELQIIKIGICNSASKVALFKSSHIYRYQIAGVSQFQSPTI